MKIRTTKNFAQNRNCQICYHFLCNFNLDAIRSGENNNNKNILVPNEKKAVSLGAVNMAI